MGLFRWLLCTEYENLDSNVNSWHKVKKIPFFTAWHFVNCECYINNKKIKRNKFPTNINFHLLGYVVLIFWRKMSLFRIINNLKQGRHTV